MNLKNPMHPTAFRTDINGLRALAVLLVILYHFNVPGFDGGFIGVDVFFVISGFLMSGIVIKGLEHNSLSFLGFYWARARRIVPALAVMCAVLVLAGWWFLFTDDYKLLGSHVVYSLAFLSNVEYWQEAGYFDVASHSKWLLHTWSLSVEWQFYLLLPLMCYLTWRIKPGRGAQLAVIGAALAASLLASIYVTERDATAAFFLLHCRAWEMLGGGMVFLLSDRWSLSARMRRLCALAGLVLIVVSNAVFNKYSAWPGVNALLPVVGSMAVLLARHDSLLLSNKVAQWLGDRSYSLYLWHWPLHVALVYVGLDLNVGGQLAGLAATLVLGHLSYSLVENRTRALFGRLTMRPGMAVMALVVIVAATPALLVWRAQGVGGRFPAAVEAVAAERNNTNPRRAACHAQVGPRSPACLYGEGSRQILVIGDSHAEAMVSGVASALAGHDAQIVQLSYSSCQFLSGIKKTSAEMARQLPGHQCSEFVAGTETALKNGYAGAPVVFINRFAAAALGGNEVHAVSDAPHVYFTRQYASRTDQYVKEFAAAITATACSVAQNRPVYLMRPIPEIGVDVPQALSQRMNFGVRDDLSISRAEYMRRNGWIWAAQDAARDQCGAKILDPTVYLCSAERCFGSKNGLPLYVDDDHLSEYGSKLLAPMYRQAFSDLNAKANASASLSAK